MQPWLKSEWVSLGGVGFEMAVVAERFASGTEQGEQGDRERVEQPQRS